MSSPATAASTEAKPVVSEFAAIARYRNSQHLDYKPEIGQRIQDNRQFFERFLVELDLHLTEHGVKDCPEVSTSVRFIEQAKDAIGRALIHAIGTRDGDVPFEDAVKQSIEAGKKATQLEESHME